jgi:predicted DNA-binding transcriptional regulator YafY
MNRIDRLTGMILLLQSHRIITADRMAEHFEISVRTVYRDLSALGEAGVPIVAEAGVGYSLMRGYNIPPVMFSEQEAAALFMSGEVTEQVADDSLRMALRSALLKIRSVLPKERHEFLNRLRPTVGVWLGNMDGEKERPDCLLALQEAVVRRRCVSLSYQSGKQGETTSRLVEPLGLMYYAQHWHLIGFCRLRNDFRDFRLDRIRKWEVSGETFEGHEDFSVKEFCAEAIRRHELIATKVRFAPAALERAKREMRCSNAIACGVREGWTVMEMLVPCVDWQAGWVLSFGGEAEAVDPPILRDRVRALALKVAGLHEIATPLEVS